MKLGLMGGTFDPPHYGHLFIAEAARVQFELDKVLFFPNNVPAHRWGKWAHAAPPLRWEMTQAAIIDNAYFEASRVELDRVGPSYSYDTICHFEAEDVEIYYIIGMDSLSDLTTWYRSAELFDLSYFIVAPRPQHKPEDGLSKLSDSQRAKVLLLDAPALEISSSDIRERVKHHQPVRYLLPDAVERVIRLHHLYQK